MTRAHQWGDNAAVKFGGRNRIWRERQVIRKFIQVRGEVIEMIALAIVDQPVLNQSKWGCGLTARKEKDYQRNSNTKRKYRRYIPADWVYYIQSAYPFQ